MVVVRALCIAGDVAEQHRAEIGIELERRCDVEVHLGVIHHGSVEKQGFFIGRLPVFEVDLSGYGLGAVDDRRGTLGNLDALKPLPRHI